MLLWQVLVYQGGLVDKEIKEKLIELDKEIKEQIECVDLARHPGYKYLLNKFKALTVQCIESNLETGKEYHRACANIADQIVRTMLNFGDPIMLDSLMFETKEIVEDIQAEAKAEAKQNNELTQAGKYADI